MSGLKSIHKNDFLADILAGGGGVMLVHPLSALRNVIFFYSQIFEECSEIQEYEQIFSLIV